MTYADRIEAMLADGSQLTRREIAARLDILGCETQAFINDLLVQGKISKSKPAPDNSSLYRYFMPSNQLVAYALKMKTQRALPAPAPTSIPGLAKVEHQVEASEIPVRLRFLRMLRDKTIFGEHAILASIITDYEWTQHRRAEAEPDPQYFEKAAARVKASVQRRAGQ